MSARNHLLLMILSLTAAVALVINQPWKGDAHDRTRAQIGPLFPELTEERDSLERIEIQSEAEQVSLVRGEQNWVVEERFGFSADARRLATLLDGIVALKTRDIVAERKESHSLYGVADGQGTLVRMLGPSNRLVAEIVCGKIRGQNVQNLRNASLAFYLRRADGEEVFLSTSFFPPSSDPASWVSGRLFEDLDGAAIDRLARTSDSPDATWELVKIAKDDDAVADDELAPEAAEWSLKSPTDRGQVDSAKASAIAWTLSALSIKDVLGACDPEIGPGSSFGFPADTFIASAGEDSVELRWGEFIEEKAVHPLWIPGEPWVYAMPEFDVDRVLVAIGELLPPPSEAEEDESPTEE